jgi:CBS domain containing-hemolysin-like protein
MRFGRTAVRDIMTPRVKVTGVAADADIEKTLALIRRTRHSRICVFDAAREVIGVLYAKDLFPDPDAFRGRKPSDLMREPYYVPETKRIDSLLEELRKKGIRFAVVVDEFGSFTGVVTLEDILESLFGEIVDEYEPVPEPPYRKIDERTYAFAGDAGINDLRQVFGDQFPGRDGERLAGIVLRHLGRFPRRHETFALGSYTLTVDDTRNREIRQVTIRGA